MKSRKILFMAVAMSLLASCQPTAPLQIPKAPPPLPADLKRVCTPAVQLADSSMGAVSTALIKNTESLNDCSARLRAVIAAWPS